VIPPASETQGFSPDKVLVTEQLDNDEFVWILRPEVIYAIRKSWEEFVVPFDEPESKPSGAHTNKPPFKVSETDKQRCLQAHNFRCWRCGWDARKEYPGISTGFLEVRINPERVATVEAGSIDPERDLVPLCGRCLVELKIEQT
jgi:predicted HNH restriction endonuclease